MGSHQWDSARLTLGLGSIWQEKGKHFIARAGLIFIQPIIETLCSSSAMFGEVKPQRRNNPTENTGEREKVSECLCTWVTECPNRHGWMDGWVWAVSFYHLWSCDRSHSINPREQYCQEKHNDLIKNSILQFELSILNPIMNCSVKAGFWRGGKSTALKVIISAYHLESISFGFTFTEVLEDRMVSYWPWYECGRS